MNPANKPNAEVILNGILDEEIAKYFHICFFTDDEGPQPNNPDNFIFIPKPVCRIVDDQTVSIQEWYVRKKNLSRYTRGRRRLVRGSINRERLRKVMAARVSPWQKIH